MKLVAIIAILALALIIPVQAQNEGTDIQVELLNYEPSPAAAGGTIDVRLRIDNKGEQAVDSLLVEIFESYPFTVVDGPAQQDLGIIPGFSTGDNFINIEFTIQIDRDALEGAHELNVRYSEKPGVWTLTL